MEDADEDIEKQEVEELKENSEDDTNDVQVTFKEVIEWFSQD